MQYLHFDSADLRNVIIHNSPTLSASLPLLQNDTKKMWEDFETQESGSTHYAIYKTLFCFWAFISCTDLILQLVWIAFKLVKFEHWLFVYFFQKIQFVIYFEAVHFFVFHQTNCFLDFYPSCHFNLVNINAWQVDMDTDKIGSVLFCYSSFWRLIFDKKECHPIYDLIGI